MIASNRSLSRSALIGSQNCLASCRETACRAAYDQEKTTPYYYSTRFDDSLHPHRVFARRSVAAISALHFRTEAAVVLGNRIPGTLHADGGAVSAVKKRSAN